MHKAIILCAQIVVCTPVFADSTAVEGNKIAQFGRWIELPQHEKLLRNNLEKEAELTPFVTDGCSGGMSAIWAPVAGILPGLAEAYQDAPPWENCCIVHDRAYHSAGNASTADEGFTARLEADEALMQCVLNDGTERRDDIAIEFGTQKAVVDQAYSLVAKGMFNAVRLGGGPCSGLPWRWGYGYPKCIWEK